MITSSSRKVAVIDGAVVPLGGQARDATLTGVSDSIVVLKKNGDQEVLLMHPNVNKRPAQPKDKR